MCQYDIIQTEKIALKRKKAETTTSTYMAKKRTKKQKIKAAAHRNISIGEHGYSFQELSTSNVLSISAVPQVQSRTGEKDHAYVFGEVRQTLLVVTSIIIGQLVLSVLIRTHIIHLPF